MTKVKCYVSVQVTYLLDKSISFVGSQQWGLLLYVPLCLKNWGYVLKKL